MGAYLYTNVASLTAQRNLTSSQDMLKTSTERLSSGKRVNSARDDAAGIGIAKRFEGNVRGIRQGVRNANDGQAMAISGEAVLEQMAQMTLRIRELAVQAANGTYSSSDRDLIQNEVTALKDQMTGLITNSKYNGSAFLATGWAGMSIQYGDETTATFAIAPTSGLDLTTKITNITAVNGDSTGAAASASISTIDTMLSEIATARSDFGKAAARLGYVAEAQGALAEAIDGARSRIEDTDYAQETANMTRNQILQQAATAALAQSNAMPNVILSLIK
jgi:flagellin